MAANGNWRIDWEMISSLPDAWTDPSELPASSSAWVLAEVPGTAASSLRANGLWNWDNTRNFDVDDWWWRGSFARPSERGPWLVQLGGLATVADVWINGVHMLHSESMWISHDLVVSDLLDDHNEIVIGCRALTPRLKGQRKPRARWRTKLVSEMNLRWYRTTFLGRMPGWSPRPAPVGPWRDVSISPLHPARLLAKHIHPTIKNGTGSVEIDITVEGNFDDTACTATLGAATVNLAVSRSGPTARLRGLLTVENVERWWPHTHGEPRLYDLAIDCDGTEIIRQKVGFRSVNADRSNDGFGIVINDRLIFARGACWTPTDAVRASSPLISMRETLAQQ